VDRRETANGADPELPTPSAAAPPARATPAGSVAIPIPRRCFGLLLVIPPEPARHSAASDRSAASRRSPRQTTLRLRPTTTSRPGGNHRVPAAHRGGEPGAAAVAVSGRDGGGVSLGTGATSGTLNGGADTPGGNAMGRRATNWTGSRKISPVFGSSNTSGLI